MLEFVREGDTVHVHDFSRLARSTKDLLEIVDLLNRKKVTLVSNKESVDSSTPTGKLMLTKIGAIAEFIMGAKIVHLDSFAASVLAFAGWSALVQ